MKHFQQNTKKIAGKIRLEQKYGQSVFPLIDIALV